MYDSNLDPDFNFDLPPNQPPAQWVNGQAVTAPLANKEPEKPREYDTSRINQVTGKIHFYKTVDLGFASIEKEVFPFGNPQDSPKNSPPPSPPSSPIIPRTGFKRLKKGAPENEIFDPRLEELNYSNYGGWRYEHIPEDVFPEDIDTGSRDKRLQWIKQFERIGGTQRAEDVKKTMKTELERIIKRSGLESKLDIKITERPYGSYEGGNFSMEIFDIGGNGGRNKCFEVDYSSTSNEVQVDALKYPNQVDCNVSGPDLLNALRKAISKVTNRTPTFVIGSDASTIDMEMIDRPGKKHMDLAKLTLLKKGMSWYNEYGFVGDYFDEERKVNEEIRSRSLDMFFRPEVIIQLKNTFGLQNITKDTSISDFMNKVDEKRKAQGGKYTYDQLDNLEYMLGKLPFKYRGVALKYNPNFDTSRRKNKK